MKPRNTRFTIIMVVFVVVFIIMPYFNRNKMARPGATKGTIERLAAWRADNPRSPGEVLDQLLNENDVTFLAEGGKFHELSQFAVSAVGRLPGQGVNVLGVSFLNNSDQPDIDRLMAGEVFDEELASELLFRNLVMNGYEDYRNIMRAVWETNRELDEGAEPLTLLGLNVELDWSVLKTGSDSQDPAVVQKVYAKGVPDTFMASVIKNEVILQNRKALIYASLQNTLSTLEVEEYTEKMVENGFPDDTKRVARIIKEIPGIKSATLFVHAPWMVEKSKYGIDYPLGGVLDSLMEEYEPMDRTMGFFTEGTPFGELPTAPGTFGAKKSRYLSELCNGYILLGPLGAYTPFTAIPEFINSSNFDRAVRNFPGPKESMAASPRELNEYISGTAANVSQILEKFQK